MKATAIFAKYPVMLAIVGCSSKIRETDLTGYNALYAQSTASKHIYWAHRCGGGGGICPGEVAFFFKDV